MTGVYAIVQRDGGRAYIGSAQRVRTRWFAHTWHLSRGRHHCQYLQRAWSKYGAAAFEFKVLEECSPDRLLSREQAWLDSTPLLFNASKVAGRIALDAEAVARRNAAIKAAYALRPPRQISEETRLRMSLAQKGKPKAPRSAEHRRKIGLNAWRLHTPTAVAKRLRTMAGRSWSEKRRLAGATIPKGSAWPKARRDAENRKQHMKMMVMLE